MFITGDCFSLMYRNLGVEQPLISHIDRQKYSEGTGQTADALDIRLSPRQLLPEISLE